MPSFLDRLLEILGDKDPVPNKFTIGMGKLIKQAREDTGLSQMQLSRMVYRRRATISDLENGKSEVSVSTLALIAAALDKPITYFLPWFIYENLEPDDLSPLEQELLMQFRKIWSDDLKQLSIRQTKEIADASIKQFREDQREIQKKLAKLDQSEG